MSAFEPLVSPLVSIVTPCLNSAAFLPEAIESVLQQNYPHIEYIVADGGSSDGTLEILKSYGHHLRWFSAADRGTADAVNRGFKQSTGEIFAYLHADDVLLPGAVSTAVAALEADPDMAGVYGDAWWIDEQGNRLRPYPVRDFDPATLARECFICQPASFVRREVFENLGGLDPHLHFAFDYEFWIRLARAYRMQRIPEVLAHSRMHRSTKTLGQRAGVFREGSGVLSRLCGYVPFDWIYAELCFRGDGRDQFFEPLEPSILRYAQSLPLGLWRNPGARVRYLLEWTRVMTWSGLKRRLGDVR
jgi:glycosyltransferase involved in cell wall biosynthesis